MDEKKETASSLTRGEQGFLSRLDQKYENAQPEIWAPRSILLSAGILVLLFAMARYIPAWYGGLFAVMVLGFAVFHSYKRFSRFRTQILLKLWRGREKAQGKTE
ncbi:MAG: hypothetical protein O2807_00830 [bacterium]|nr:hypothetical protein [bacterium]